MSEFKEHSENLESQAEKKETREQERIGRISVLRHGQTQYTDIYPDLTDLGKATIEKTAEQIAAGLSPEEQAVLLTSPTVRAQGTTGIIKEKIGHEGEIKIQSSLSMNRIKDQAKAQLVWDELKLEGNKVEQESGAFHGIDYAYTHDPRFENAEIFEPRSQIEKRFFNNLEYAIRAFEVVAKHPDIPKPHLIAVSHFELLNHFVQKVFKLKHPQDPTVKNGELIEINLMESTEDKQNKITNLEVSFRGLKRTVKFDRKARTIIL